MIQAEETQRCAYSNLKQARAEEYADLLNRGAIFGASFGALSTIFQLFPRGLPSIFALLFLRFF